MKTAKNMKEWFDETYILLKEGVAILKRTENPNPVAGVIATSGSLNSILILDDTRGLPRTDYNEAIGLIRKAADDEPYHRNAWMEQLGKLEQRARKYFPNKQNPTTT